MADADNDTVVAVPSPNDSADDAPTTLSGPSVSASGVRGTQGSVVQERSASAASVELATRGSAVILRREEAERIIAMMKVIGLVAALAGVTQWIPRDLPYRGACSVVYAFTVAVTLGLLSRFRDRSRYDHRLAMFHAGCAVASVLAAAASVGVFSGTIVSAALGIFFYGSGDDKRLGWFVYATGTLGYAALFALTIGGVMPLDRGLVAIAEPDVLGLVVLSLELQAFLAFTFWSARRVRSATREAFLRLEGAARRIEQREALLDEARADLDREQAARLGRYTGQSVGEYMVDEVIGRGAMGDVYAARAADGSPAALKFLNPNQLTEPGALQRFLREAEIAGTLKSPHVTRLFGTGEASDGAPYLAMELLVGEDLGKRLRKKKRMSARDAAKLVREVAEALEVARERGVVHRDIKPQNLFLASEGGRRRWKVLDFGVSKIRESHATLTQGAAIGTPSYMSPEQARGKDLDHRSDVFALGVVAYRMLTGRPAFTGADSAITLYNVIYKQPERPSEVVRLGPDVERVLALTLAKDREQRPATARLFARALADALGGNLEPKLREAADRLIAKQPWGEEIRHPKRPSRGVAGSALPVGDLHDPQRALLEERLLSGADAHGGRRP